MIINKVHNIDFLDNTLPDKCANLIIADPPYYKTKGDFDFIWKTFEDYLIDVEKWALECKRLLADNGTLFWYGGSKNIAYSQIIFDKYFGLINNLVWEKAEADGMFGSTGSEQLRSFPNSTERILMYSNENFGNSLEENYDYSSFLQRVSIMKPLMNYMNSERLKSGLSIKQINDKTKTKMGSIWFTHPSQWQLPTKEWYLKLRTVMGGGFLEREYSDLSNEYEKLKLEYEILRRPFNNFYKSTEILKVRFKPSEYDHPTVKPEKLSRILIKTCSRENDLIIVPFAGSGTECAMSAKEKRNFIGYEITKKHADISNKRCKNILSEPTMF